MSGQTSTQPKMPTAAKLFSSVAMMVVGFISGTRMLVHLQDMNKIAYMVAVSSIIGLIVGWKIVGRDITPSFRQGINAGMKGAVISAIYILAFIGAVQASRYMMRGHYDGPMEAVTDAVAIAIEIGGKVAHLDVIGAMLGGGAAAGLIGVFACKRWK